MKKWFLLCSLSIISILSSAQEPKTENVKVFIDCNAWCDFSFIKTEINYVDFVPDRFTANVYVMVTSQTTGSGGQEISLFFSGQQTFKGMEDTLKLIRSSVATDDEYRNQLVKYLKLGLTRFIAKSSIAEKLSIQANVEKGETPLNATANKKDPWNFWVMNVRVNGHLQKDDYSKNSRYSTGLEASRTTEKLKVTNGIYFNKNELVIKIDNNRSVYPNKGYGGYSNIVKSINDHWSYGGEISYEYSTFSNYESEIELLPAIEYSLFPYKDAVKKAITVYYEVGPTWNQYIDSSYYGKLNERIVQQSLSINFGFTQKWGNVYANASWQTFLNNFSLEGKNIKGTDVNRISFGGSADVRIVKGLSFNIFLGTDFTKGVFPNLRRKDFNREDILSNVRQIPTTNNIFLYFGLNYRFGSIYNNVVNPRFNRDRFF
jgi:hypothetical protein